MRTIVTIGALAILSALPAQAAVFYSPGPGSGPPPPTLGGYTMFPFPPDPRPIFTPVTTVPGPFGELGLSPTFDHRRIGAGWAAWSHGYDGDVYYSQGATSATITPPPGMAAFYFYITPNPFSLQTFTVTESSGTTSGPFTAHGAFGATYVGFYADPGETLGRLSIFGTTDFAIGEFAAFGEPVGACCLGLTECIVTTEATCTGNYLGDGVECPVQTILIPIHEGTMEEWTHVIETVGECPEPAPGPEPPCTPGPPMFDPWITHADGSSCMDFGAAGSPAIPADFFAPGSEPFMGTACFQGVPLGPTPFGDFGEADTLIRRTQDPFDRCAGPSDEEVTIPIELVALNLVSINPIAVTVGTDVQLWNVAVDVSPTATAPPGSLTAIKTHCNGGTFTSVVNVYPRFTFTKVDEPSEVRVLDTGATGDNFVSMTLAEPMAWVSNVDPGFDLSNPICTDFHPGISEDFPTTDCAAAACPYADVNCDGVVDGFDISVIRNGANWLQSTAAAAERRADVNEDGVVDGFDIAVIRGGLCWLQ